MPPILAKNYNKTGFSKTHCVSFLRLIFLSSIPITITLPYYKKPSRLFQNQHQRTSANMNTLKLESKSPDVPETNGGLVAAVVDSSSSSNGNLISLIPWHVFLKQIKNNPLESWPKLQSQVPSFSNINPLVFILLESSEDIFNWSEFNPWKLTLVSTRLFSIGDSWKVRGASGDFVGSNLITVFMICSLNCGTGS